MIQSKLFLSIFIFVLFHNSGYSQNPRDTSKKENSTFWTSLLENFSKAYKESDSLRKYNKDSLDKYYKAHPVSKKQYIQSYLITKQILPNEDAVDLIKKMNPEIKNIETINFYTTLRVPVFKKINRPDRIQLKKEWKKLKKYDKNAQNDFATTILNFQNVLLKYRDIKIKFSQQNERLTFESNLTAIENYLSLYKKKKLAKGTANYFGNEVNLLDKLLQEIINKKSANTFHVNVLKKIRMDLYSKSLLGFYEEDKSAMIYDEFNDKSYLTNLTGPSADEITILSETSFNLVSNNGSSDAVVKSCLIYAKRPSKNHPFEDEEIFKQYYFSFQPLGNAVFNCQTGECSGFNDGPNLISANGANVIPGNYVFRFQDKDSKKYYYRCITKDLFDLIENSQSGGNKKKYKIIFNPESSECRDFFW